MRLVNRAEGETVQRLGTTEETANRCIEKQCA